MNLLFPLLALLWLLGSVLLLPIDGRQQVRDFLLTTLISAFFCVLWNLPRFPVFAETGFYAGDSLYTLGVFKASALACLTTVFLLSAGYVSWSITCCFILRHQAPILIQVAEAVINGVLVLLVYWFFLSIIPQLYYTIYLLIFPGLPSQWVVKGLIPIDQYLSILQFSDKPSLSSHAAGLLGWVLFVNALLQWLKQSVISVNPIMNR